MSRQRKTPRKVKSQKWNEPPAIAVESVASRLADALITKALAGVEARQIETMPDLSEYLDDEEESDEG